MTGERRKEILEVLEYAERFVRIARKSDPQLVRMFRELFDDNDRLERELSKAQGHLETLRIVHSQGEY